MKKYGFLILCLLSNYYLFSAQPRTQTGLSQRPIWQQRNNRYLDPVAKATHYANLISMVFGIPQEQINVRESIGWPRIDQFTSIELEAAVQARNSRVVDMILQNQGPWPKQTIEKALNRLSNPHILYSPFIDHMYRTRAREEIQQEEARIKGLFSSYLQTWE